jgi:hypothetical protein
MTINSSLNGRNLHRREILHWSLLRRMSCTSLSRQHAGVSLSANGGFTGGRSRLHVELCGLTTSVDAELSVLRWIASRPAPSRICVQGSLGGASLDGASRPTRDFQGPNSALREVVLCTELRMIRRLRRDCSFRLLLPCVAAGKSGREACIPTMRVWRQMMTRHTNAASHKLLFWSLAVLFHSLWTSHTMGEKRKRSTSLATNSKRKRHALPPVRPLTRVAEAFSCRLDQIKETLTDYLSRDQKPDAILNIAIALTNMENILDIKYPSDTLSDSSRVFCSACRKPYTRSNDMHEHVKDQHKRLQPPVVAVFCRDCNTKFEEPRQLVGHERFDHHATYKSRLEFVWPGFVQTNSEPGELQIFDNPHLILICQSARNSFLQFLRHGDKHAPISTLSVGHNADDPAPPLGSRTSASSSAQNQTSWDLHDLDFQTGFYDDLTSLLLPSAETLGENIQAGIDSDFYNNLHHLLSIENLPIENHSQPSSGDIIRSYREGSTLEGSQ